MRALLWVTVLLVALWSGYWFVGKGAVERAATGFFETAPAQGLEAAHEGLVVRGFPNRFDLTVTEPRLADPATGLAWEAPFFQILSLSYRPWHVIAAFPPQQRLTVQGQALTLDSGKLQASVVVSPNTRLTLDRTTLVGDALALSSATAGWTIHAQELRLASRSVADTGLRHQLGLEAKDLRPDQGMMSLLPGLPGLIDSLRIDAELGLTAPIDRFAGQARPEIIDLALREARLIWGGLDLTARGEIALSDGVPEGRVDITLRGWRLLVPMLVASGILRAELAPTVERMLETLALQSGSAEDLALPLILAGGQMRLGPLPLGPAPRF
jgi:hypothetical protein